MARAKAKLQGGRQQRAWEGPPSGCSHDVAAWTIDDVCAWLEMIGCGAAEPAFREHFVFGAVLLILSPEELRDTIGVTNFGLHRMILVARDWLLALSLDQLEREHAAEHGMGKRRYSGGGGKVLPLADDCSDSNDEAEPVYAARVLPPLSTSAHDVLPPQQEQSGRAPQQQNQPRRQQQQERRRHRRQQRQRAVEEPNSFKVKQAVAYLQKRGANTSYPHYSVLLGGSITFFSIALLLAVAVISVERVPPWYLLCAAEPLMHGVMNAVQHASAT